MGTTVAEKKGDWIDLIIDQKKRGLDEPSQFGDYPSQHLETLRIFVNTFRIPSGGVPSKRSRGKFSNWVDGLEQLEKICPVSAQLKECMEIARNNYDTMGKSFIIYQPQSVVRLLIDAVAEWNRKKEEQKEKEEIQNTNFADSKTIREKLGSLFDED